MRRYFKNISGGGYIFLWKSKGLSVERINSITATNYLQNYSRIKYQQTDFDCNYPIHQK